MARELLSVLRFANVATLPGGASKGDACVRTADGHLYVFDGTAWIDTGASGGGSSGPAGVTQAVVDFGATPHPARAFDIADPLALTSQSVLASIASDAAGDFEREPLCVAAHVISTGTIRCIVASPAGNVSGLVRVNYLLGNTPVGDAQKTVAIAATYDNFDPEGARVVNFTAVGANALSGILSPVAGAPKVLVLVCDNGLNIYDEASVSGLVSDPEARIRLGIYAPGPAVIYTATLVYDDNPTVQKWRFAAAI